MMLRTWVLVTLAGAAPLAAQGRDCDGYFTPLVVPTGFCPRLLFDSAGPVHQVIVHPSGQVVMATDSAPGLLRFSDENHAGKASPRIAFGPGFGGTALAWRAGWLYFASDSALVRYRWPATADHPDSVPEWIDRALPTSDIETAHNARGVAVAEDGSVYVSFGSVSDNCQVSSLAHAVGRWPCSELDHRAGIWRYVPPAASGGVWVATRFATGIRNAEAMAIDLSTGTLWAVAHGRDQLGPKWDWPDSIAALQPAEMLERVVSGGDYGWPYCQGIWARSRTTLAPAPEYTAPHAVDCGTKSPPVVGFPGHWAPVAAAMVYSTVDALPHPGLYITFRGNGGTGHFIAIVPFDDKGQPNGDYRVVIRTSGVPGSFRPDGFAVTLDGTIYVTDGAHGRVYRIEPHAASSR